MNCGYRFTVEINAPAEPATQCRAFSAIARVLEEALKIYEVLNLELWFLEAWKVLDMVDRRSLSRISDRAYKTFGKEIAHRMAREVSGIPDPPEAGGGLA